MADRFRVLELFCGIGGCAAALGERAEIVAAVDINQVALSVYRHNFRHPVQVRAIESLPAQVCREYEADLWWMSPPCQPYTVRGRRLDVDDPRAESLLTVIPRIAQLRPRYVALENVPGFGGSRAHQRLRAMLDTNGYEVQEQFLCPTQLGIPNRRRRFYLVAGRSGSLRELRRGDRPAAGDATGGRGSQASTSAGPGRPWLFTVRQVLDADPPDQLWVSDELLGRYRTAIHVVDADDAQAESHCFTSSYGQSIGHSGSYLAGMRRERDSTADDTLASLGETRLRGGVRRFSPQEILRLLCFPPAFRLPGSLTLRKAWELAGNSLSVAAVRHVLAAIPELATLAAGPTSGTNR
ncbi:MAG TPA: DNA cytosine methyltransferase [Candidatus Anammoximicrobium sp.]|nr:DNA cytosine methyltransferase [Candidatus Anammoximicrobium sp.]